jgi:hypothetical protein
MYTIPAQGVQVQLDRISSNLELEPEEEAYVKEQLEQHLEQTQEQ